MTRSSHRPPTRQAAGRAARERWPSGPVEISTGTVEVVPDPDDADGVTVLVNGVPSSYLDLADARVLVFEYMQQMAAVVERLPDGPLDVVHLGAGACALPRALDAARPGSHQLAVELDATLPELVRSWFDLPRSPALRVRTGDARAVVEQLGAERADVVVRDVFAGDRTPAHVCTVEMAREVHRVLRTGGVYLVNCADRAPLTLARSEVTTLREVFGDVAVIAEPGLLRGRGYGNVVLAATDDLALLADPALARAVRSLPAPARLLHGDELLRFAAAGAVLRDPA